MLRHVRGLENRAGRVHAMSGGALAPTLEVPEANQNPTRTIR